MRAVVLRDFQTQPKLETIEDPVPKDTQVLLKTEATAVNYVDLLVIGGKYQFLPERPFVPGKLPAGVVEAVGKKVKKYSVGDRILTLAEQGGYAEKAAVEESQCFRLPSSMSFVDAASMALAYDTAWFALRERARCKPGDTVLILGASGGVGLASIQLGKAFGLKVYAGIANSQKRDVVLENGADEVIDLSSENLREDLRAQIFARTENRGIDIILDMVGGDYFDAAVRALAWRGRLVSVGFASGRIPQIKINYLLLKNIEVSGLQVSDYRKRAPDEMAECINELFELYAAKKIRMGTADTFALNDFAQALEKLQNRQSSGRLVLDMNL